MGAVAIDVNDIVGINAAALRVLSDNLGDDATRVFINQFKRGSIRESAHDAPYRRVTALEISEILENARMETDARRNIGEGDYTAEKKNLPQETFEEAVAGIMATDAEERVRWGSAVV